MTAQPKNGHDTADVDPAASAAEMGRKICEPGLKVAACHTAELTSLASRRMQAYAEMPARMAACRTPQELFAEQSRFAQAAMQDYVECSRRIVSAYQTILPHASGLFDSWHSMMRMPGADMMKLPAMRDFLGAGEGEGEEDRRQSGPRRAA